jgi:quinol monooxygenase YgiN
MATYLANITVKSGCERDFEAIVTALHDATHATEPGVRRYEYWRGAGERNYYCHASFDDFHAFLEHQISDHHEAAGPQLSDVIETIRLEWVDPVISASPLAPTDMQPLPDGSSEATERYHQRFAA